MSKLIDVLLLFALPASGKSEVRKYLASLTPEQSRDDFLMGPTVQLDDYPYVHIMRTISEELQKIGAADPIFFEDGSKPMKEGRDWGTLIHLVNEDFDDLMALRKLDVTDPAQWILDRFDAARAKVGAPQAFKAMDADIKAKLLAAAPFVQEAKDLLRDKNATIQDTTGKTIVIEAARGGADGASMPLAAPYGYQYSIGQLSDAILSRAGICYIWVSPEESRRKNTERAKPQKAASTFLSLNHGVPMEVMMKEYGSDDMAYLLETSGKADSVKIEAHGKTYFLPVARFDNREDKTTFVRADKSEWKKEDVAALHNGLAEAFHRLAKARD
ncbi:MAG: hypothetical protein LBM75_04425 [Myxococcales bacterium]|jgi:hypothetical protein|nr:hypothetical protein [Myxococcales bacterium]